MPPDPRTAAWPPQEASSRHHIHHAPFTHAHLQPGPDASARLTRLLAATYPHPALHATRRLSGSDKNYSVETLTVRKGGRWTTEFSGLSPAWQDFLGTTGSPTQVAALCQALDVDPALTGDVEMRFAAYPPGGWMSRHTDGPDKLFSVIYYVNPWWLPQWGGEIRFYAALDSTRPACQVHPGALNGVAFARSDHSWHEVAPVAPAAGARRQTLLIHGYRESA